MKASQTWVTTATQMLRRIVNPSHNQQPAAAPSALGTSPPPRLVADSQEKTAAATAAQDQAHHQDEPPPPSKTPYRKTHVAILWDLDHKHPHASIGDTLKSLRRLAAPHGKKVDVFAAACQSTLDRDVRQRAEARRLSNASDSSSVVQEDEPLRCPICGNKAKTLKALNKHYKMLHDRERDKKLNKLAYFKAKKPSRARKMLLREGEDLWMRNEAHRVMTRPNPTGHGLMQELKSVGVPASIVPEGPDAAGEALTERLRKLQRRSVVGTLVVVSDNSFFRTMIEVAGRNGIRTVAVGQQPQGAALGAHTRVSWDELVPAAAKDERVGPDMPDT